LNFEQFYDTMFRLLNLQQKMQKITTLVSKNIWTETISYVAIVGYAVNLGFWANELGIQLQAMTFQSGGWGFL